MPRHEDMPLCSPTKSKCIEESKKHVEESNYLESHGSAKECECLPACTEIHYPHETSISSVKYADMLHLDHDLLVEKPKYKNDTYINENLAIVHVYFKHLHFIKHERGQLYGPIDFIANVGGILGLAAGFSILSLAEFFYFVTLRLFCHATNKAKSMGILNR